MFTVSSLVIVVKLVALAKERVIADKMGTSMELDAFLAAYLIPNFVILLLAIIPFGIVPTYIELKTAKDRVGMDQLVAKFFWVFLGIVSGITALLWVFGDPLLNLLFGGRFSEEKLAITRKFYYLLLPVGVIESMTVMGREILRANKFFTLPSLMPVVTPICCIIGLFLLFPGMGVQCLVVAYLVAAVLQAVGLWIGVMRKCGHTNLIFDRSHEVRIAPLMKQIIPLSAANVMGAMTALIDSSMAAQLGDGALSTYTYADKTCSILLMLGMTAVGTTVLPYFATEIAEKNWARLTSLFRKFTLIVGATGSLAAAVFVYAAPMVVSLLFERGEFTSEDTGNVSRVLQFLGVQIPFHILALLANRTLIGFKVGGYLLGVMIFTAALNIVLNLVFSKMIGVSGIALSTAIVHLASCLCLYARVIVILRQKGRQPE